MGVTSVETFTCDVCGMTGPADTIEYRALVVGDGRALLACTAMSCAQDLLAGLQDAATALAITRRGPAMADTADPAPTDQAGPDSPPAAGPAEPTAAGPAASTA